MEENEEKGNVHVNINYRITSKTRSWKATSWFYVRPVKPMEGMLYNLMVNFSMTRHKLPILEVILQENDMSK